MAINPTSLPVIVVLSCNDIKGASDRACILPVEERLDVFMGDLAESTLEMALLSATSHAERFSCRPVGCGLCVTLGSLLGERAMIKADEATDKDAEWIQKHLFAVSMLVGIELMRRRMGRCIADLFNPFTPQESFRMAVPETLFAGFSAIRLAEAVNKHGQSNNPGMEAFR